VKPRLLLVEDEPGLVLTLTDRLAAEGYGVDVARDGESGLARALSASFDLLILDVMLPRKSGFDVCRELRAKGNDTPVLMLTARGQVADKVVGLKLGADDYLTKPFEMAELLARIEARLRRRAAPAPEVAGPLKHGELMLDPRRAEVRCRGLLVELSARELELLQYFLRHPGATLSREELLREVWGYDALVSTRTVDVHVAWLRRKLEQDPKQPRLILTVHGLGYKLAD
jgi:two-component system alkaline phosphatase synthesis response regulator PhoP